MRNHNLEAWVSSNNSMTQYKISTQKKNWLQLNLMRKVSSLILEIWVSSKSSIELPRSYQPMIIQESLLKITVPHSVVWAFSNNFMRLWRNFIKNSSKSHIIIKNVKNIEKASLNLVEWVFSRNSTELHRACMIKMNRLTSNKRTRTSEIWASLKSFT